MRLGLIKGQYSKAVLFSISSLFFSHFAYSKVLVNPPSPLPQHVMGDQGYTMNFGGSPSAAPATGFYNSTDGYRFIQTTATDNDNLIWLDVSTNQNITLTTGQHIVVTLSTSSTAGSEIPLIGAGTVSGNVAPRIAGSTGPPPAKEHEARFRICRPITKKIRFSE